VRRMSCMFSSDSFFICSSSSTDRRSFFCSSPAQATNKTQDKGSVAEEVCRYVVLVQSYK
jgi:hypothetical protein